MPAASRHDSRQRSLIFFDTRGIIYRAHVITHQNLHLSDEFTGLNIADLLTVEYRNENLLPELLTRFDDPETDQATFPKDAFIRTRDRRIMFFADGFITRIEGGRFLFSFRNVAEEVTQEYMVKMALSSTKIFPWYYDFAREVMVIDPRYYEYTGIPTEDGTMTLEAFSERLHPDDRAPMAEAFGQQLSGIHYPHPVPYRLRRGDGTYEWFEGQSTYLGQVEGLPYRVVGICMSTQAFKNIEEALTLAKNRAEQSDKLKSAFLANMSHEIRTPLNAIVGFSNLLAGEEAIDTAESREYAALINKNCDYLLTLVSDILDLSSIETGAMEFRFAEYSLARMLTDIYEKFAGRMPEGVKFNLLLPPDDVRIDTDVLHLRQVMDHLVGNAVKFTRKGRIDLGCSPSGDGTGVRLFVADTGCGIPADKTGKIFERFYKIDAFKQGAGLGLAVCKTIMEGLGGRIDVTSRPGKGSRFTVKIPTKRQH